MAPSAWASEGAEVGALRLPLSWLPGDVADGGERGDCESGTHTATHRKALGERQQRCVPCEDFPCACSSTDRCRGLAWRRTGWRHGRGGSRAEQIRWELAAMGSGGSLASCDESVAGALRAAFAAAGHLDFRIAIVVVVAVCRVQCECRRSECSVQCAGLSLGDRCGETLWRSEAHSVTDRRRFESRWPTGSPSLSLSLSVSVSPAD